jgi:hypothetical protein
VKNPVKIENGCRNRKDYKLCSIKMDIFLLMAAKTRVKELR